MSSMRPLNRDGHICILAAALVGCGDSIEKPEPSSSSGSPSFDLQLQSQSEAQTVRQSDQLHLGTEARQGLLVAVNNDEDVSGAAYRLAKAEGLELAWAAIESLEDSQRNQAFQGWVEAALEDEDITLVAEVFRAYWKDLTENYEKQKVARSGARIVREWIKVDFDTAEAFAKSLDPGIARMNALEVFVYDIFRTSAETSASGDEIQEAIREAADRWELTHDERSSVDHLLRSEAEAGPDDAVSP